MVVLPNTLAGDVSREDSVGHKVVAVLAHNVAFAVVSFDLVDLRAGCVEMPVDGHVFVADVAQHEIEASAGRGLHGWREEPGWAEKLRAHRDEGCGVRRNGWRAWIFHVVVRHD